MQSKLNSAPTSEEQVKLDPIIEVVERLKNGCHLAYEEIYLQWRKPIFSLLYSLIGNAQDAEDITQDTFTKLWEHREKVIPEKGVRAILYVIARNSAMQLFRDRRIHKDYAKSSHYSDVELSTSYDALVQRETELLAEVVLNRLPPQQQQIFRMSSDRGMSADEISEALDIKRETVYQQLSRARGEMSKLLGLVAMFISI